MITLTEADQPVPRDHALDMFNGFRTFYGLTPVAELPKDEAPRLTVVPS